MVDVDDEPGLETAVHRLTDTEQEIIAQVLARDEEVRELEEVRLSRLNFELLELREKGVPEGAEADYGRVCLRCRSPLGVMINSGTVCCKCGKRICNDCKRPLNKNWICIVCLKEREVKAESGAWFYDNYAKKGKRVYGSALLKRFFRRLKDGDSRSGSHKKKDISEGADTLEHSTLMREDYRQHGSSAHDEGNADQYYWSYGSKKTPVYPGSSSAVEELGFFNTADEYNTRDTDSSGDGREILDVPVNTPKPKVKIIISDEGSQYSCDDQFVPSGFEYSPRTESEMPDDALVYVADTGASKSEHLPDEPVVADVPLTVVGEASEESEDDSLHSDNDEKAIDSEIIQTVTKSDLEQTPQIKTNKTPYAQTEAMDSLINKELADTVEITGDREAEDMLMGAEDGSDENSFAVTVEAPVQEDQPEEIVPEITKLRNGSVTEYPEETKTMYINQLDRHSSFESDVESLEGEFKSTNVIAGEILLGMKFEEKDKKFEVQIHKVRDLPPADSRKNTTDPYVKTYLLPDKSKSGKRKTKAKKHSLNPEFDEILTYKISYEELITRKLWVSVWHHDTLGHNLFLGEVQVVIEAFVQSGFSLHDPIPQWYTLSERTFTRAELKACGDIKLSLKYVPPGSLSGDVSRSKAIDDPASGILLVKVISAKNLKPASIDGTSNPFARLIILPEEAKNKPNQFNTSPITGTLNPQWDQEFSINSLSWSGLHKQVLELTVYDHEPHHRPVFLGGCRLGLGKTEQEFDDPFGPETAIWKTTLDNPNEWHSVTVPLRSSMESLKQDTSGPPVHIKRVQEEALLTKDYKTGSFGSLDDMGSVKKKGLLKHADQLSLSSFGSMLSIYSDAGGHGSLTITGDILFSIKYDNVAGVFEIAVVKAKNIAVANQRTRSSDPYVKTYMLPDKSKTSKKKSSVRRRTVNPEWNETIKYKIGQEDLMKRTLQLSLWNNDKFGQNDFLGEVQVQIQKYVKSGHSLSEAEPVWYTLQDTAPVSIGAPGFQGELTVAVKHDSDNNKLMVDIREAKGLPAADSQGRSDPFVKSYLLPDKSRKTKRKTKVVKKCLDPKWNEKFEYDGISMEELEGRVLELTVWDQDKKENLFLGGTRIGLKIGDEQWHDSSGKEVELWQSVLDRPNIWNEYIIPLRDSMTSRKGLDIEPPSLIMAPSPMSMSMPDFKIDAGIPAVRLGLFFQRASDINDSMNDPDDEGQGKSSLKVHIKEGRYLPARVDGQSPNTFCKCFVTGKKKSAKKKTNVYLRATEPIWDAEVDFPGITEEELSSRGLEVQILDDNDGKSVTQIGFVRLGLGQLRGDWDDSTDKEIALWESMISKTNQWTYMMLPVREPEKSQGRSLTKSDSLEINTVIEKPSKKTIEIEDEPYLSNGTKKVAKETHDEGKSPKALALEAMGESASNVISILESKERYAASTPEPEPAPVPQNPKLEIALQYGFDSPNDLSLSPIEEEAEELEIEPRKRPTLKYEPPKVTFNPVVTMPEKKREPEPAPAPVNVPEVVVTKPRDDIVKPGDPPFKTKNVNDYAWDDEDDEAALNTKKSKKDKKKPKMLRKGAFGSQESLNSIQSTRSEDQGIFGRVVVKGEIQIGFQYDYGSNAFEIHVYQARDIAAVDTRSNTSDSYVKTYLMPDKTKATKKKTRVKKNTLDPEWNQIIEYKMTVPEIRSRVLVIQVWNRDRLSRNDFLGEVQFRADHLFDEGKTVSADPIWYTLSDKGPLLAPARHKGILNVAIMFEDPDLKLHQRSSDNEKGGKGKDKDKDKDEKKKKKKKAKSKLIVNIISASDLPAGDRDGYSDPFCKCQLLPIKGKTKRKTQTLRHTLNPVWDYRTEYDVDYEELAELGLEITVWDWDRGSKDDFLGCVRLNLGERNIGWDDAEGKELEAWKLVINRPNRSHDFELPLRSIREANTEKVELD